MKITNANNQKKILINNKKLSKIPSKKSYLAKIPKCSLSKNTPKDIPNNKNFNNKNNNIILKNKIIKNYSSTQATASENEIIPYINPKNDYLLSGKNFFSFTNKNSNKSQKIKRRIYSFEKKSNDSFNNCSKISLHYNNSKNLSIKTSFENLKAEIYYYLDNDISNHDYYNNLDKKIILNHKNTILKKKLKKLKDILNETNKYKLKLKNYNNKNYNNIEKNNSKDFLKIYIEKYNALNNHLQELNKENYVQEIKQKIATIQHKINFYEKGNQTLSKINNDRCQTSSSSNINNISHNYSNKNYCPKILNINFKKTMNHFTNMYNDLDNQMKNKLLEYNNLLNEEILLSKKINNNDLLLKTINRQLSELKLEFFHLLKISKNIPEVSKVIKEKLNISENYIENSEMCINMIFCHQQKIINLLLKNKNEQQDILNSKKAELSQFLEKFEKIQAIENSETCNQTNMNTINSDNNSNNNNINLTTKRDSIKINEDTRKKFLFNLNNSKNSIPISKINKNISNNNLSKEIILQNLSIKEKEEKNLINVHETSDFSNKNKFKHIKIKPNFSFVNEHQNLLSEKAKSNLQFSGIKKEKDEEINEDIECSHSNNKDINCIKLLPNNNKKKINYNYRNNFDSDNNCSDEDNNSQNKNKNNFSTNIEQREKVLNTILYSDIMDYNELRDINDLLVI